MAQKTYDILRKNLLPEFIFQERLSGSLGLFQVPSPTMVLLSDRSEPFAGLVGTGLTIRVDELHDLTFTFDTLPDPATAVQVVASIQAQVDALDLPFPGASVAVAEGGRVALLAPAGIGVEIFLGNQVLGFYEKRPEVALLKTLTPMIDEVWDDVRGFFDIVDPHTAPGQFLPSIAALLGYSWDPSLDTERQLRFVDDLPFFIRFKGTRNAIRYIVRRHEGIARVFESYPYIGKYEDMLLDGERVFPPGPFRDFNDGVILPVSPTEFRFIDLVNSPFVAEDIYRYLYIPDLHGPTYGYRIDRFVSASEVAVYGDHQHVEIGSLFYQIREERRTEKRLESRDFWTEGVYEVISDIPPATYRDALLQLTHPAGRLIYFRYEDSPEIVPVPLQGINTDVILRIDQFVPQGYGCGLVLEVGPPLETSPDASLDGCRILFGPDIQIRIELVGRARRYLDWSRYMHWEWTSTYPLYVVPEYAPGRPLNTPVLLPEGHTWEGGVTDQEGPVDVTRIGFSADITRGSGPTDPLPPDLPFGTVILVVNQGGTPNHTTDSFTGGTTFDEYDPLGPAAGWTQTDGASIDWSNADPSPDQPVVGTTYRIFYSYDEFQPFVP